MFGAKKDMDPESPRLVLWPDHDYICNHDKGQEFFSESAAAGPAGSSGGGGGNAVFETIPDCGHIFHADGTFILSIDWVENHIRVYLLDFSQQWNHNNRNST